MTGKKLRRSKEIPYHITARGNNREEFPGDRWYIWKTLTGELFLQQILHNLAVHSFVLMPNHFHLIVTSPERDIDQVMRDFISSATRIVNHRNRRSGRIFGGRYYWSLISDARYYANVLKYVYRNPVRANLALNVADYPFSTYSGFLGFSPLPVSLHRPFQALDSLVPKDAERLDTWLNQPHSVELNEAIRKGLRREEFQIHSARTTRRNTNLEIDALATPERAEG